MVVFLAYAIWSLWATRSDLAAARASADQVQRAVTAQDSAGAKRGMRAMQQRFSAAHDRTDGPLWSIGARLPFIGDDVRAVRTVSAVGDQLSRGSLADLVAQTGDRLANRLVPHNGRIDIAAVESISPLLQRGHRNFDDAAAQLQAVEPQGLTRWVRPSYDTFAAQVGRVGDAVGTADRAARVLPTMLGKDGPRTYLVMFDNNAEIRATGGLPGAFSVLQAQDGVLSMGRQGAGSDIRPFAQPVLPQSEAEHAIYDDQIAEYLLDTNFTPEFPRTAELAQEMWRRAYGAHLDGVLSIDAVSLSYLLRATGPIDAPDNVRLTAQNATAELLSNIYFRLSDPEAQNRFFRQVARRVFERVTSGVASPAQLVTAFADSAREGRLYLHDFDPTVQNTVSGTVMAGEVEGGDPRVPQVGVYLNDATGSKMSYYLRTKARLQAESCAAGVQQLRGTADLTYTADGPPTAQLPEYVTGGGGFGTPAGEQLVLVRIYGPQGGELNNLRVAGQPLAVEAVEDRGRKVATVAVQLRRGETIRVSWRVRSGPHQDRPAQLSVSPGMLPERAVRTVAGLCESGD